MSARSGDDELRCDQSRLLPCLEGSFFSPVEFVGKVKKVPFGREGRLGGLQGHASSYCYILAGWRDEQCLKKEMDGTGSTRTGAPPILLSLVRGSD